MGYCIAFIKFKIKIYFQTSDFGFSYITLFLAEKIKLYNCINIKSSTMKMVKTFSKDISTTQCDAASGKIKYTQQIIHSSVVG